MQDNSHRLRDVRFGSSSRGQQDVVGRHCSTSTLIEGGETIDLLFVDLKIQDDVEGGLKLAKKAVEARPNLKVLYTSGQTVTDGMMATEALYGRAVGYDPFRQI
jgi:hypothetical protein